jgi:di/tricarboxylate transporter
VLFVTGWLRVDVTAMLVMLSLLVPVWPDGRGGLQGLLDARQAFSGFGSPAVLMLAGMFVLSASLVQTGAASLLGERLLLKASRSVLLLQATLFVTVAGLSTLVSNTTTVLVAIPLALAACRRRDFPPSKVLMPIAIASLLGGQWTLIGTRSNVLISDFVASKTGAALPFFSFTPVAAIVFVVCLAWFLTLGRRLLPTAGEGRSLAARYDVTEYLTEILATPNSRLVGRTLAEIDLATHHGVTVLQVIREDDSLTPTPWLRLAPRDVLVVQGRMSQIDQLLQTTSLEFKEELALGERTLRSVDLVMVEAVVAPHSDLEGRTLREVDFMTRFGASVLGIGRRGHLLTGVLADQRLRFGDSLLIVGHSDRLRPLRESPDLLLVDSRRRSARDPRRAWAVIALLAAVAGLAAAEVLEPAFAIVAAAVAAVLMRCVNVRQAYEAIDWKTLVVVGGMIPYSVAMEVTGSDRALAQGIVSVFHGAGPQVLFAGLLLVVLLLTQVLGNATVAVLIGPLAWRLALAVGADPMPFLIGSALCTSASFMMPVAHEATLLVMGPGGYRGRDYLRVGLPFALITWAVTVVVLPWFYPLT